MPVVSHTLTRPGGVAMADEVIHIRLLAATTGEAEGFVATTQTGVLSEYKLRTDAAGTWSLALTANALITPANTTYQVIQPGITGGKVTETFIVPNAAGPFWLGDILAAPVEGLPGYALDLHDASASAHIGTFVSQLAPVTKANPVDACHPDFGANPVNADNLAAVQAAVDSLGGKRGDVIFSIPGTYTFVGATGLDRKRARLRGLGAPGQNGGAGQREGGTVLHFTGTGGVFSSIKDDFGAPVMAMELRGSGDGVTDNGQVLLDYSGINYPRLRDVRFWLAGTGLRLRKGAEAGAKESHYGAFFGCDFNQCFIGIDWPAEVFNGSHKMFGGRFWSCKTGAKIGLGVNDISFFGTAFEVGAGNIAVDSTGTNVCFFGVRWETANGSNLVVRAGAGPHWTFGDHWSSGLDITDENIPSVVFGVGTPGQSGGDGVTAAAATAQLVANGAFKRDANADGRADSWLETFSSTGGQTYALVVDPYGEGSAQQVNSGTANNLRVYQNITCVPNVWHVLRVRIRVNAGTNNLIRIGSATTNSDYGQVVVTTDNAWREYRVLFKPTAASVFVTVYLSGTTTRTAEFAGAVVSPGNAVPPVFVPKPLTEDNQQAANPDTSGATLAALETEVNEMKQLLRNLGLMAT